MIERIERAEVGSILINGGECGLCHWVLRSHHRLHEETCLCGAVTISGGVYTLIRRFRDEAAEAAFIERSRRRNT